MVREPFEDDTPFSLPKDVPENMPIDYPGLDSNVDSHEAYDEGLDDIVDTDPYREDDDPIKSSKRLMRAGAGGKEKYTTNHDVIRAWAKHRFGHPARIKDASKSLDEGGLYIYFEDREPDIEFLRIKWSEFFKIFEHNHLAFLYKTKTLSGSESRFYKFLNRRDADRISTARRIP